MKIEKVGKQVKQGLYTPHYISAPIESTGGKMKTRYSIEQQVSDDIYDIYDMFADCANALNELIELNPDLVKGDSIAKWTERQGQIKKILGK